VTDPPVGRHPNVAAVFLIGLGLLLVAVVSHRVVVPAIPAATTLVFFLGLFGFGIAMASGLWYVSLFVRDLL
jgi:hypothetical protein